MLAPVNNDSPGFSSGLFTSTKNPSGGPLDVADVPATSAPAELGAALGAVDARPPLLGSRTQIRSKAPDFDGRQDHPGQRPRCRLRGSKLFIRRGRTMAEECRQFTSEVRSEL
jgi:hypothetical protein